MSATLKTALTPASSSIKAGGSITADTGSTTIIGSNLDAQKDVAIKNKENKGVR